MQADQHNILSTLVEWLKQDKSCYLCTVTETWGSSPRPVGSLMIVSGEGEVRGSLSGGCIEDVLVNQLTSAAVIHQQHIIYGANDSESDVRVVLPCGGQLGVFIEYVDSSCQDHFTSILEALDETKNVSRVVKSEEMTISGSTIFNYSENDSDFILECPIGPQCHLFIIGASDVGWNLAELASWLGYSVSICDPRHDKISQRTVEHVQLITALPDEALLKFKNHDNFYIVTVAHDPRVDDMAMLVAFSTKAKYIGAMGSVKTSENRRERLAQLGISAHQVSRLHAPVGMDIGSKKPRDIALSIMAHITSVANGK